MRKMAQNVANQKSPDKIAMKNIKDASPIKTKKIGMSTINEDYDESSLKAELQQMKGLSLAQGAGENRLFMDHKFSPLSSITASLIVNEEDTLKFKPVSDPELCMQQSISAGNQIVNELIDKAFLISEEN